MSGAYVHTETPVDGVPSTHLFRALDATGALIPGPRVGIIGLMHGNEPVGDHVLTLLHAQIGEVLHAGEVFTVRANLRARDADLRYTSDGQNMNRLWDPVNLVRISEMSPLERDYEEGRVHEIAPLLGQCDAILDLHSTSRPAPPFLLFRDDQRHSQVASKLGVERLVTGLHELAILDGGLGANIGLRPGEFHPRIGFTFEAGEHTDPQNALRAWQVVQNLLIVLGLTVGRDLTLHASPRVYDVIARFRQVRAGETPYRFVGYSGGEAGGGRNGSPRHLASFEQIESDEVIVKRGNSEVIRGEMPFTMLMPAPTADPGDDLYYVALQRHGGLDLYDLPRTDQQAKREALAVERMLDLISDDSFERGETWASFDSKRVFDLCAEQIGKCIRLPQGHPHRMITVVGRGDWGGDETERRAGQAYRHAMQEAMVSGVPMERVQLLRGASVDWLEALSSKSVLRLLNERSKSDVVQGPPLKIYLSERQPHTVSILVIGDLDKGLKDRELRHVRVVLVIESANLQPAEERIKVRTFRTGLIAARLDFLRATWRLVQGLKAEHRSIVQRPPLSNDPEFLSLLHPDGGIQVVPDKMTALRRGLRALQYRRWRSVLSPIHDRAKQTVIPDEDVSNWLAQTMYATGIRDPHALRELLTPTQGGYRFDLDRLNQVLDRSNHPAASASHLPVPRQILSAKHIVADTLERWVGWKRFISSATRVPNTRGKDIELAFSGRAINRRMAAFYRVACEIAERMPGRVMVVVAGDGHNPARERPESTYELMAAHREVVVNPKIRYLRIQNAQGTHLSWMRDLLHLAESRPNDGEPAGFFLESDHGSSVNVVLVCVKNPDADPSKEWSLDNWSIERCGVVLSDLGASSGGDYQFGVFTELRATSGMEMTINYDLVHFARAHCQGLIPIHQSNPANAAGFETLILGQLEAWVQTIRSWMNELDYEQDSISSIRTTGERLGLTDHRLVRVLVTVARSETPSEEVARTIWNTVPVWPGRLWTDILHSRDHTLPLLG